MTTYIARITSTNATWSFIGNNDIMATIILIGGGAGGAGGGAGAAGSDYYGYGSGGGGGRGINGANGKISKFNVMISPSPVTYNITIGAGGNGGAGGIGGSGNGANGSIGTSGGSTSFGSILVLGGTATSESNGAVQAAGGGSGDQIGANANNTIASTANTTVTSLEPDGLLIAQISNPTSCTGGSNYGGSGRGSEFKKSSVYIVNPTWSYSFPTGSLKHTASGLYGSTVGASAIQPGNMPANCGLGGLGGGGGGGGGYGYYGGGWGGNGGSGATGGNGSSGVCFIIYNK